MTQRGDGMRLTSYSPCLHVEIHYRDEGEAGEVVNVRMYAAPGVEALMPVVVRALSFLLAAANPFLAGPMGTWAQMARLVWRPWLQVWLQVLPSRMLSDSTHPH